MFHMVFFSIPLPPSLILGTVSAEPTKSSGMMGCSREVAGGTRSAEGGSQRKLPSGDGERGAPHSRAPSPASSLPVRAASTERRRLRCIRPKINASLAVTCELRALRTEADFHFTWSVPAYRYCSGWTAAALPRDGCWTKDVTSKDIKIPLSPQAPFLPSAPSLHKMSIYTGSSAHRHGVGSSEPAPLHGS